MRTCETGLNGHDCDGVNLENTRVRCFACGDPTCRPCSSMVRGHKKGHRVRMCADCQEDYRADFASGKRRRDRIPSGITQPKTAELLLDGTWSLPSV